MQSTLYLVLFLKTYYFSLHLQNVDNEDIIASSEQELPPPVTPEEEWLVLPINQLQLIMGFNELNKHYFIYYMHNLGLSMWIPLEDQRHV